MTQEEKFVSYNLFISDIRKSIYVKYAKNYSGASGNFYLCVCLIFLLITDMYIVIDKQYKYDLKIIKTILKISNSVESCFYFYILLLLNSVK